MSLLDFRYLVPRTLDEAVEQLERYGDKAKLLAGGQSLLLLMKLRLIQPEYLIDLKRIEGLSYLEVGEDGVLKIGALVTHGEVEASLLVKERWPLLAETARLIGHPQIRNRGTIGGSLCHADPSADWLPTMVASDAMMVLYSKKGERRVRAEDFFLGPFTTDLRPGEVLKEVRVPPMPKGTRSSYLKLSLGPGDFAIVSVAVILLLDGENRCEEARIVLGGVGDRPIRAVKAEETLKGKTPRPDDLAKAAQLAQDAAAPSSDLRASAEYRREMVRVYTKRCLQRALKGLL